MLTDEEGDQRGQDYFRPLKRLAEDCDRDGNPVSQIGSNNSSHTTKKKGKRKHNFTKESIMYFQMLTCVESVEMINSCILGVKSFCIDDILSHKTAALQRSQPGQQQGIVRPWDQSECDRSQEGGGGGGGGERTGSRRKSSGDSPLDALFNMASNFEALKAKSGKFYPHYSNVST